MTRLLEDWSGGDEGALEKLIPLIQPELHRLAHHYMSRESPGHTLQTTALLNEAYLRLVDNPKRDWQNRTHFIAAAAQLMRRIMVDHARERRALKRGGGAIKVELGRSRASDANSEPRNCLPWTKPWKSWPRRIRVKVKSLSSATSAG